jgi:hypothetical protein
VFAVRQHRSVAALQKIEPERLSIGRMDRFQWEIDPLFVREKRGTIGNLHIFI